jgi:hypothetical protein
MDARLDLDRTACRPRRICRITLSEAYERVHTEEQVASVQSTDAIPLNKT